VGGDEVNASPPELGPPPRLLLDTHVLLWLVEGYGRLGSESRAAIDTSAHQSCLYVSAITPWEIGLLVSKGRLQLGSDVMQWISAALAKPGVQLAPLDPEVAVASTRLPFEMHADPADRILVATARHLGATLVTADRPLMELSVKGYFRAVNAEA
jgi:PIN domain nuclease of toxin-antitoxin system